MKAFFYPEKVAVIGVSAKKGSVGNEILKNLKAFKGSLYAVNPKYSEIEGVECYPSVSSLPETVDLAIITTPAQTVVDVVQECGRRGIKNIIVISAGFKETGVEGERLEERLIEVAKKYNIKLFGPNCLGLTSSPP